MNFIINLDLQMDILLQEQRINIPYIGKLGRLSKTNLERIINKILNSENGLDKNNCWIWIGTIQDNKKGHSHGCIWYNKNYVLTHRIMYHNFINDVPIFNNENEIVLHKCSHHNDGKCVNPWHMKLGTFKENTNDALKDGTLHIYKSNEQNPMSKLSNEQIIEINSLKGSGLTQKEIAQRYNVNQSQISRYWNTKTRKII
jgi:predicted XRE-type DNA-binding protein